MIDLKCPIPIQEILKKEVKEGDNEYKNFLKSIQTNIVRSHYCNYCRYIFVRFNQESKINEIKKWLSQLEITSAFELLDRFSEQSKLIKDSISHVVSVPKENPKTSGHLNLIDLIKQEDVKTGDPLNVVGLDLLKVSKVPDSIVCLLFISDIGWDFLGFNKAEICSGINIHKYEDYKDDILRGNEKDFDDSINNINKDGYPHIMIQVASYGKDPEYLNNFIADIKKESDSLGLEFYKEEEGKTIRSLDPYIDKNGVVKRKYDWKEPFGFSDGVSQPFFFKNLAENEASKTENWSPEANLELAFIKKESTVEAGLIAYFSTAVYMKIKQSKDNFKENIKEIAKNLEGDFEPDEKTELAEAYIIGRFKDGTPVKISPKKNGGMPILNNFVFEESLPSVKCPYFSHIFKANPREKDEHGKYIRIVRRGIPYAKFKDGKIDSEGLHFLSYQKSIKDQFIKIYVDWIKSPSKVGTKHTPGYDLLLGNIDNDIDDKIETFPMIPKVWGQPENKTPEYEDFINLKEIFKGNAWKKITVVKDCVFFIVPDLNFIKNIEQM